MIEYMRTIVMENEYSEYETSAENLWSTIQDILIVIFLQFNQNDLGSYLRE